ncbi:MAG: hypothetical protein Q8L47_03920 [bacterium]|nr:hypothetical protein [bacterium]
MLIAFAILTLSITAGILVIFGNQSIVVDNETNSEALSMAVALIEKARADSRSDFNLVNPITATEVVGSLTYSKILDVQQMDFWTKKVSSAITWTGEHGRNLNVQLSTLLTNPDAMNAGDTCSSVLVGDWSNPQKTEYEFGADILNDTSSGFPITSMRSFMHKLYITVHNDNGNNDETFFILDISNPSIKPIVLEKIDNNLTKSDGLNDIALGGVRYVYVANAYSSNFATCVNANGANINCGQMQVIDLSVSPPQVVYTYKVPGVTGNNGAGIGRRIFYKDGIVYLGLAKTAGPEFHIIDVGGGGTAGASPTSPKPLGSFEIDNGVNAVNIRNGYAYIASPNNEELKILSVSNPLIPSQVGFFNAPGGGGNNGNGKSLSLVGNKLYFGRTLLNGNEFYILNNSNPETSLPVLGFKDIRNASNNNTSVNGLIIRDYLAFLITNEQFQIWRIDNPNNITQYDPNPFLTLPPGQGGGLEGTTTDCEGNYIYVGSMSSNDKGYVSIITSQ